MQGEKFTRETCVFVLFCVHISGEVAKGRKKRAGVWVEGGVSGGEGGVSDVLLDVIKTGPYTNNFMAICCLQSAALSALKLQCEPQTRLPVALKCCLRGETAILLPKP